MNNEKIALYEDLIEKYDLPDPLDEYVHQLFYDICDDVSLESMERIIKVVKASYVEGVVEGHSDGVADGLNLGMYREEV